MSTPSYNISSVCLLFKTSDVFMSKYPTFSLRFIRLSNPSSFSLSSSPSPDHPSYLSLYLFPLEFFPENKTDPQKYFYRFLLVWAPVVLFATFWVRDFCCVLCVLFVWFQLIECLLWFISNSFDYTCNSTWSLFFQFHNSPNAHCSLKNKA